MVVSSWSFIQVSPPNPCMHLSPICVTYRKQSQFSWFGQPNNVRWGVQIRKFLIIQSSPVPCYLISITPNCLP